MVSLTQEIVLLVPFPARTMLTVHFGLLSQSRFLGLRSTSFEDLSAPTRDCERCYRTYENMVVRVLLVPIKIRFLPTPNSSCSCSFAKPGSRLKIR